MEEGKTEKIRRKGEESVSFFFLFFKWVSWLVALAYVCSRDLLCAARLLPLGGGWGTHVKYGGGDTLK